MLLKCIFSINSSKFLGMENNEQKQVTEEIQEIDPIHDIALSISQRSKTEEDGIQAKCHCEDILRKNDWLLETNVLSDFLNHQGTLNSFEVSVDDSIENRVGQLVEMMKEKTSEYGMITDIIVQFLISKECAFRLEEVVPLGDWLQSTPHANDDTNVRWWISYDEKRNHQVSAIVLAMHEPR